MKISHMLITLLTAISCAAARPLPSDASCSPESDAEFVMQLTATCKGKPLAECPEANKIGDEYEQKSEAECLR